MQTLRPKLLTILRDGYRKETFFSDLAAGIVVGIVALPLAIAFAIASGVKPEQGLYTAIVAGFVIALLGGSRVQVSGPTGAFIVVIYGIVQQYGYDGLAVATFLAGIILVAMGLARMGGVLKFIPYPLTVGFTSGIALIIFSSQVPEFLGLSLSLPADLIGKWSIIIQHLSAIRLDSCAVGAFALSIMIVWPKVAPKIPCSLIAIVATTVLCKAFEISVDTIGSRFGEVPSSLPMPRFVEFDLERVQQLIRPAITIALLGAIESLLSAVVADGMLGTRHRSNMELVAQGAGNMLSPLFLGIPATGAIARTATNIKSGGRTPIAAITHSIVLLLIMLCFGRWAALIPMPTLAAILIVVAWNMSERHNFLRMFSNPRGDLAVMLSTFALTIFIDLTVAIEVGIVMSALVFLRRMAVATEVHWINSDLFEDAEETSDLRPIAKRKVPPGVEVFEVFGPLFFGMVESFKSAINNTGRNPKVLILRMRNVSVIDASGVRALDDIRQSLCAQGARLILSGIPAQTAAALERAGFIDRLGPENIGTDIDDALKKASEHLDKR